MTSSRSITRRSRSVHEPAMTRRQHHDHITYSDGPCAFTYPDGLQCVWVGELTDGMCVDHRYITKLRENARRANRRRAERLAAESDK